MYMKYLLAAALLLPVLCGAAIPLIKPLRTKRGLRLGCFWLSLALTDAVVLACVFCDVGVLDVLKFTDTLRFSFFCDGVSKLFALLAVFVYTLAAVYCAGYFEKDEREGSFYGFLLLSLGALLGICFSENLLTAYTSLELLTLSTVPLVLHSQTDESRHAAMKYMFYSIAGALMGLLGLFFADSYCSTLSFTAGGTLDTGRLAGHEGLFLIVCFIALVGFGAKAGLLPLSSWLPTAHPAAPSPASALLSGIVTKAGVVLSLRFVFYVVGADFIAGTWVQYAWLILILATILSGSVLAAAEHDLKKRIAWSTVSQVSYILLGLACLTPTGFEGALLHTVFHSLIKNALFLICGIVIFATGKHGVDGLSGLGKKLPITMLCYYALGIALTGIPPFSAFFSKWKLLLGSLEADIGVLRYIAPAVLLISAILTAYYMLSGKAFFSGGEKEPENSPAAAKIDSSSVKIDSSSVKIAPSVVIMLVPVVLYALLTLFFGIFPDIPAGFVSRLSDVLFH